jgi:hypothetical protein
VVIAAGRRSLLAATQVSGVTLLIDAKNEEIAKWYGDYGAVPLLDSKLSLVLPLQQSIPH